MGRIGIVTDAHSNPWGQDAVFDYLEREGVDRKIHLGDMVGMFPNPREVIDRAREECGVILLGNHESIMLRDFEDDSRKRQERIMAAYINWFQVTQEQRDFLDSLPLEYVDNGVLYVHNSPFNPKERTERYMHDRFQIANNNDKILELSNSDTCSLVFKGHSHKGSVWKIKRGLREVKEEDVVETHLRRSTELSDTLVTSIDSDFVYVFEVGSACGANTIFTKDEDLDYRPSGAFFDYDSRTQTGEVTLFRTEKNYNIEAFVKSVKSDSRWEKFEEAQRQINYLKNHL